jgi:hypothetical protein
VVTVLSAEPGGPSLRKRTGLIREWLKWQEGFLTANHVDYADFFRVFRVVRGYRSGHRSAAGRSPNRERFDRSFFS